MRYFVDVGGREHEVLVRSLPDGSLYVEVGGQRVEVDAVALSPRVLTVRVDGRVMDLTLEGQPPTLGVVASGRRTYVNVESERLRAARIVASAHGAKGERDVRSPMPGRVVKVLVAVGETVGPNQPVVVIEAMKMENEVRARKGGVVASIEVTAGAAIESNAVLVKFQAG